MPKKLPKLSQANFEIMRYVWEHGDVTVNQVLDAINSKRAEPLRRTSVQVQMNRLEKYGWLRRKTVGHKLFFSAARDQDSTVFDIVDDVRTRVFDGSSTELVRCLFANKRVEAGEISKLRQLLDEYEQQ